MNYSCKMHSAPDRVRHSRTSTACWLAVLVGLWLSSSAISQPLQVYYVDASRPFPGAGTTWQSAFVDLRQAMVSVPQYSQIWVRAGVYRPDPTAPYSTQMAFRLRSDVEVYGGFAGWESLLTQRNPGANLTVLSGDLGLDDMQGAWSNRSDNSSHVVVADGQGASGVLDGFTIRGGEATTRANTAATQTASCGLIPATEGGGLFITCGAQPTIRNCIFEANRAETNGGAAYVDGCQGVNFIGCTIRNNGTGLLPGAAPSTFGLDGGGLAFRNSGVSMQGCTIESNWAFRGAGIYAAASILNVANCTIRSNEAGESGGGLFAQDGSVNMVGTRVSANLSPWGNGAGVCSLGSIVTCDDCWFEANVAGYPGGGLHISRTLIASSIRRTTFANNVTTFGSQGGGGLSTWRADFTMKSCQFFDNQASFRGGAVHIFGGTVCLANCTLFANSAGGSGGGIYARNDSTRPLLLSVGNSILWRNSAAGNIDTFAQMDWESGASPTVSASDIDRAVWENLSRFSGPQNFSAAPLFRHSALRDLHLRASSPCIDRGLTNGSCTFVSPVDLDIDGQPRQFINPTSMVGQTDVGADEAFTAYPGSDSDLRLVLSVNGTEVINGTSLVAPGNSVVVTVSSPTGTFANGPVYMALQYGPEGSLPGTSTFTGTYIDPLLPIIFLVPISPAVPFLPPGQGVSIPLTMPILPAGTELLFQAVVAATPGGAVCTPAGCYSATDAYLLRF